MDGEDEAGMKNHSAPLLSGGRWVEIPLTLSGLLKRSGFVGKMPASETSKMEGYWM